MWNRRNKRTDAKTLELMDRITYKCKADTELKLAQNNVEHKHTYDYIYIYYNARNHNIYI